MANHYDNDWFNSYEAWLKEESDVNTLMLIGIISSYMIAMEHHV